MYLEYIIIVMAIIILYLIYYVFSKDSEYNKNIHAVASVVEELNRELYYLKNTTNKILNNQSHMSDDEIYQEIEKSVYRIVQPLSVGIKKIQENIQTLDIQIDSRISSLEIGVREILKPSSPSNIRDDKILSLFHDGYNVEEISKELHISKSEVDFVLKLNHIQ